MKKLILTTFQIFSLMAVSQLPASVFGTDTVESEEEVNCSQEIRTMGVAYLFKGNMGITGSNEKSILQKYVQNKTVKSAPEALKVRSSVMLDFRKGTAIEVLAFLKEFSQGQSPTTNLVLKVPAQDGDEPTAIRALNGMPLFQNGFLIKDSFILKDDKDSEVVFFQLTIKEDTVVLAFYNQNKSPGCDDEDDSESGTEITPRSGNSFPSPKELPFIWPLTIDNSSHDLFCADFFGPRIFGSTTISVGLENGTVDSPVSVISKKELRNEPDGNWSVHKGVDMRAQKPEAVHAISDGTVYLFGRGQSQGNFLVLKHELSATEIYYSLYFHLTRWEKSLKLDAKVKSGQLVALSGGSGCRNVRGKCAPYPPHLHVELREPKNGIIEPRGRDRRSIVFKSLKPINLADYLKEVQTLCQKRKTVELNNATELASNKPTHLGPLTASQCDEDFEAKVRKQQAPLQIYFITKREDLKKLK